MDFAPPRLTPGKLIPDELVTLGLWYQDRLIREFVVSKELAAALRVVATPSDTMETVCGIPLRITEAMPEGFMGIVDGHGELKLIRLTGDPKGTQE